MPVVVHMSDSPQFVLQVSYSLDRFNLEFDTKVCAILEAITGDGPEASGAGFGQRDLEYSFSSNEERAAARAEIFASKELKELDLEVYFEEWEHEDDDE